MSTGLENINTLNTQDDLKKQVYQILETVLDPEVPVLSVVDLGIIRDVQILAPPSGGGGGWGVEVFVTPTYSGCPAIDIINVHIRMALLQHGFKEIRITQLLSPAWTTDWISEAGREKLKAYGIAPPHYRQSVCTPEAFQAEEAIQCPLCQSYNTRLVSQFGSTACKALYQCNDCKEPFDYFKCH
ncbi:MAG: phenylacetate-CoA oxygenase subunit PaaJ [Chitinophagaceae bacterium]|nr:phenylacetate-CoA oxygenase subunit PaaJ [Chitinophagaceae bacterium]